MSEWARRTQEAGAPVGRERWHLRRVAVVALLALSSGALASCTSDSRPAENSRRRDAVEPDARRRSGEPRVDTTSLVTPVRIDSLIGAARGAGGNTALREACAACHGGAHATDLGRGATTSLVCVACHDSSHEPIQAFYAGDVRGVSVAPDTMFLARVSCMGCHTDTTFGAPAGAARAAALDRMCTSCHGTRFGGMLAMWQDGVAWRAQAVAAYVGQASADSRLVGADARARVQRVRQSMELLRIAGAMHNVRGADQLLRAALDSTAVSYARAGLAAPVRPALGPDPTRNKCLGCHYGVESSTLSIRNETFNHASHLVRADLACRECHSDATYFKDGSAGAATADKVLDPRHGKTTLTATSCESCHHSPTTPLACTACHTDDSNLSRPLRVVMALSLQPAKAPASRAVEFRHTQHSKTECTSCHATPGAVRQVATCSSCHADHHKERAAGCTSCHGSTMLTTHTMDTHFKCASCHARETVALLVGDRAFCVSCHVKQVDHEPARECSACHLRLSPTEVRRRILADQTRPAAPSR